MVTVAGSRDWESVAWYPCGLRRGSGDDGKASQLSGDLTVQTRPGFSQPKTDTPLPKPLENKGSGGSLRAMRLMCCSG